MSKKIPQGFIQELLDRVDIVDLIGRRVAIKKKGINYSACCPFHKEKTPSFSVNQDKQFFYCFGCGKHGNALTFLMDHDHLEFVEAIEELATQLGLDIPYENFNPSHPFKSHSQNSDSNLNPDPDSNLNSNNHTPTEILYQVMQQASLFFQHQLRHHPEAQTAVQYLKSRGLSGQIAKTFCIGYAPDQWDALLKHFPEDKIPALLDSGLLIKNDQGRIYDRFRHRIIFPIHDRRGRVVGFGGRVLNDQDKPKYLNSPETPIFHKGEVLYGLYESRKAESSLHPITQVILVEGYMDVVALHEHGLPFAMATLGTASSESHFKSIFKICKKLIICFDGDHAGRQAALRALNNVLALITGQENIKFLFVPEDQDPDSLIRQEGKEKFLERAEQALSLSDYLLQILSQDLNLQTLEGRSQLVSLALPYLNKIPESHYKDLLINKISEVSGLASIKIKRQLENLNPETHQNTQVLPSSSSSSSSSRKNSHRFLSPLEKAMAYLIQYPEQFSQLPQDELLENSAETQAYNQIIKILTQNPKIKTGQLFEYLKDYFNNNLNSQPDLSQKMAYLSQIEFDLSPEETQEEIKQIILKQVQEPRELALSALMEKSKLHELSPQEKQILRELLKRK